MSAVPAPPSSPVLDARLCGAMTFTWQGQPLRPAPRLGALLAYVILSGPISREGLRETFWQDGTLQHVRQALYTLRALPGAEVWLVDAGGVVGVQAETDLPALDSLLSAHEAPLAAVRRWPGGELLAGFRNKQSGPLEKWPTHQQTHRHARQVADFERCGMLALAAGQAEMFKVHGTNVERWDLLRGQRGGAMKTGGLDTRPGPQG